MSTMKCCLILAMPKTECGSEELRKEKVEYCLKYYHTSYTDSADNPIYIADLPTGRQIKVVVKADSDPMVVITVADQ